MGGLGILGGSLCELCQLAVAVDLVAGLSGDGPQPPNHVATPVDAAHVPLGVVEPVAQLRRQAPSDPRRFACGLQRLIELALGHLDLDDQLAGERFAGEIRRETLQVHDDRLIGGDQRSALLGIDEP